MSGKYSVYQFFVDGSHENVRLGVAPEEAVKAALHYSSSIGAQMGTTVRVIITDDEDFINYEWIFGKGITFPSKENAA